MTPIERQTVKLAREKMQQGLSGSDLVHSIQPLISQLNPTQRKRVASRISKEHHILGKALHDPNLFKNCDQAAAAKKRVASPHLMMF
mgnify:CR=1 FL=1